MKEVLHAESVGTFHVKEVHMPPPEHIIIDPNEILKGDVKQWLDWMKEQDCDSDSIFDAYARVSSYNSNHGCRIARVRPGSERGPWKPDRPA